MLPEFIITDRQIQKNPSYDIIHEWEDELNNFGLELKNSPYPVNLILKACKKADIRIFKGEISNFFSNLLPTSKKTGLYFEMHPLYYRTYSNSKRTIPIIIDFFNKEKVDLFKKYYSNCLRVLVTNLEVIEFLKQNNFESELVHFPMALPSKYKLYPNEVIDKKYDIIVAGRANIVLWDYLNYFVSKHPEINYLFPVAYNGKLHYKINNGEIIGNFHSRAEYMNLIKMSRVSFYATPGMDNGAERTQGFNPITPRFFELLSGGCHILARYPKTIETDFYNIESICPAIETYEQFESELNKALNAAPLIKRNAEYLSQHYLSNRINILQQL